MKKDKHRQEHLGPGGLGSQLEKPQHPRSSAHLLHRVGQRGDVIVDS